MEGKPNGGISMNLKDCFPIWSELTSAEQDMITRFAVKHKIPRGMLHLSGSAECPGLIIVSSGQLRIFISSEEGRELTLFRLFSQDICLFSAACVIKNIKLNIDIEAEKPSEIWIIPINTCKKLMTNSITLSNYINQLAFFCIEKILNLLEQVMWESVDKRLALFLLEESLLEKSSTLKITHEKVADHIGTAREVVTRILKSFQTDEIVRLSRGYITIIDSDRLKKLSE